MDDATDVLANLAKEKGLEVRLFDTAILDRVGMKRAIQEGLPTDFKAQFQALWAEIQGFLNE